VRIGCIGGQLCKGYRRRDGAARQLRIESAPVTKPPELPEAEPHEDACNDERE
jgi:hypothetical protein